MMRADWRERNDAVAESYRHTARREGHAYRALCPFCQSSKTGRSDYSLGVEANGLFFCHRCQQGGKLRGFDDAAAPAEEHSVAAIDPPEGWVPLGYEPGLTAESLEEARAYALRRHLTPELWRTLEVGAVLDGYYAGRLVIPVLDDAREWLGFVSRDWTGRAAKPYLYSKGLSRARFFNHAAVLEETDDPLLVVEGVLDAVCYWPDAVAMLGKLTDAQKHALRTTSRPVALVYDGDAHREARSDAMELREFYGQRCGYVRLPPKVDPDEVDFAWLRDEARACLERSL